MRLRTFGRRVRIAALGDYDGAQLFDCPFQNVIDEDVAVFVILLNLVAGRGQTFLDDRFLHSAFRAAAIAEPPFQHVRVGGEDKDGNGLRHALADLRGALHVDVDR